MTRALILVLAIILQSAPVALTATWQTPHALAVTWQSDIPVCLYVAGGNLPDQRLIDVPCGLTGSTLLRTSGDSWYVPQSRERVELRRQWGLGVVASVAVPRERWRVILPIIRG